MITPSLLLETFKSVNHLTVYRKDAVLLGMDSGDHGVCNQQHVSTNKPGGIIPVLGPTYAHIAPGSV